MDNNFEDTLRALEAKVITKKKNSENRDGIYWIELMARYLKRLVRHRLDETNTEFTARKHSINAIRISHFLSAEGKKQLGIKANYISNTTVLSQVRVFCAHYKSPNQQKDENETLWDLAQQLQADTKLKLNLGFLHSALPESLKGQYSKISLSYEDMAVVSQWLESYESPNQKEDKNETLWDLAQQLQADTKLKLNLSVLYSALPESLKSQYSKISLSYKDMAVVSQWLESYESPNQQKDKNETLWDLAQQLQADTKLKLNLSVLHSALPKSLKGRYSCISLSYEDMAVVSQWLESYKSLNQQKESTFDLTRRFFESDGGFFVPPKVIWSALSKEMKGKIVWIDMDTEDAKNAL